MPATRDASAQDGDEGGWRRIASAPSDRDLELAVIDDAGIHALVFPCRRRPGGWADARTGKALERLRPTHWRAWTPE